MGKNSLFRIMIVLIFMIPGLICGQNVAKTGRTPVKLGVSTINVTPLTPVLMSGYSSRTTPYTAIHDSLYASALFFTDGKTKILLITSDLIGYPSEFIDDLKKTMSGKIDIPVENIMITAVHNHGGPVTRTYETNVPESVINYVNGLKEKLVSIAVSASEKAVPFRLGVGKGTCNMNMNRREHFEDGSVGLGKNPDGPCDHEVTVVKLEDMNNNLMAVLLNWPCHGTASGDDNYQITADWPGAAARYIKKQAGKDVVTAVTAGASADIDPIYGPGDSFRHIEGTGFIVGIEAWKVMSSIKTLPVYTLQTTNSSITFPGKARDKDNFPQTNYESRPDVEIRLTGIRVGNLIIAGVSGELMNEIGMEVKQQSPYTWTMVVTHCNGSSGYICTDKAYSEGGYEPRTSKLMPGIEKPLIQKFMDLISSL
jgi:neutral ceramidase